MPAAVAASRVVPALALALPALAFAQAPDPERSTYPLTDPARLVALGYAPDARHVHERQSPAGAPALREDAPTGGPGQLWTSAAGFEFHPLADTVEYVKGPAALVFNGALVSFTAGGFFEAQLQPPPGALTLDWVDLAGFHNHSSQILLATAIERCLPFLTGGNPTETVLSTQSIADQDGAFVRSLQPSRTLSNATCTYHVRVRMGDPGPQVAGVLIQLVKARAEWGG
jgi:hypothetical protein